MIRPETHLIAPVNQGLFLLSFFPDIRILFFKPTFHFCRVLLIRTAQWLLRRKTPTCKVPTNRPDRKTYTKSLLYQLGHCFPSPKIKRKLELFRATIRNGTDNLRCLPGEKCPSFRSTLPLGLETFHTAFTVFLYPSPDSLASYTKNPCYFNLSLAIQNGFHRLMAKIFLSNCRKRSCIMYSHALNITP